jgi:hypothetical protein
MYEHVVCDAIQIIGMYVLLYYIFQYVTVGRDALTLRNARSKRQ